MELSTAECERLGEALEILLQGRWRSFEDHLWINFGDRWTPLRDMLIARRHIVLNGPWKDEPRLTDQGRLLLERLRAQPRAAAG